MISTELRLEHDLLGDCEVPDDVYYGVHTAHPSVKRRSSPPGTSRPSCMSTGSTRAPRWFNCRANAGRSPSKHDALVNGQWWMMVNQCGEDLLGKSTIIAPDGSVVAQAARVGRDAGRGQAPELLVVSLGLEAGIREAERESGALWADHV
ncbi:hypothetical protein BH09ACT8_BH09ACT8_52070 [soil metagenome]